MIRINFDYDSDGDVIDILLDKENYYAINGDVFDLYKSESDDRVVGLFIHRVKKQTANGVFYNNHISVFWSEADAVKLFRTNYPTIMLFANSANTIIGILIQDLERLLK